MTRRPAVAPRYAKALREQSLARMRAVFRSLNPFMVLMWRTGLGRVFNLWPSFGGRLCILINTGRKTGTRYRTPLNYAPCGNAVYCLAGFGSNTDWFRNVLVRPDVEAWLPSGRWSATATDASGDRDRVDRVRDVLVASGFAARAIGLNPRVMTDEEVAEATHTYRLVRIEPTARLAGGPADLAWIWPLAGCLLRVLTRGRSGRWPRSRIREIGTSR